MHTQLGYVLCVATMQLHVTHVDIQVGCTLYVATMQLHTTALFDITLVSHVQVWHEARWHDSCRTIYNRVPLWWFTGNGCMCLYHKWVRVRVFVFLYHGWHMRGFWRDNVWIWHVSGRAYCVLKFWLSNEGLNERNTLPSTVTYSETNVQQHAVRQL